MDAPLYPPASVFVRPERVAYQVSTRNTPIAELMKIPAAWRSSPFAVGSFQATGAETFHGRALAILRSQGKKGALRIEARAEGLQGASGILRLV